MLNFISKMKMIEDSQVIYKIIGKGAVIESLDSKCKSSK